LAARWPFNKLKKIFLGYKDANDLGRKKSNDAAAKLNSRGIF
jgi:hypothetical protein